MRSSQNGTAPSHADPWIVSASSQSGSSACIIAVAIGQCANSRSFQRWVIAQRPAGNGRGLCDVRTKYSRMAAPVLPGPRSLVALPVRAPGPPLRAGAPL